MKKILSLLLIFAILVSLVTTTFAEGYAPLLNETFETATSVDWEMTQSDKTDVSSVESVDNSNDLYFGLDNKVASFRSNVGIGYSYYLTFPATKNIRRGKNSIAGYTVDISFDLKVAEAGSKVRLLGSTASGTMDIFNNVMGMKIQDNMLMLDNWQNDEENYSSSVNLSNKLDEISLTDNHFKRIRLVIKVNDDSGNYVGKYDLYIDGVNVASDIAYDDRQKQALICAIAIDGRTIDETELDLGVLDNISINEYDASSKETYELENPNSDKLISSIRKSAYVLENGGLSASQKDEVNSAVANAKSVYENSASTTEEMNAAADILLDKVTVQPEPEEETFNYIVDNSFEDSGVSPLSGEYKVVTDNTPFINKAIKFSDAISMTSEIFEGVNVVSGSSEAKGTDSIMEFDIKFEDFIKNSSYIAFTQRYDQTPDGTPISVITFKNGDISYAKDSKTNETLKEDVFVDGEWYRVKFVLHAVETDGSYPNDMSLYVNGELMGSHFLRRSTTGSKTRFFNQFLIEGLSEGASVYFDNLKIYRMVNGSSVNPPILDSVVAATRKMAGILNSAVVGDNKGEYDADDYSEMETYYNTLLNDIPNIETQAEVEQKYAEIIEKLASFKPNSSPVALEGISYSSEDVLNSSSIDITANIRTSKLAPENTDITMISALYEKNSDYVNGKFVKLDIASGSIGKKDETELSTSISLSEYTNRENLLIKTYFFSGKDMSSIISSLDNVIGNVAVTETVLLENYGSEVEVYRTDSANSDIKLIISTETVENDSVWAYVIPENASVPVAFNIINTDNNAKGIIEIPQNNVGNYKLVVVSENKGVLYNEICTYADKTTLDNTLNSLKTNATTVEAAKGVLNLDGEMYMKCINSNIDIEGVSDNILQSNNCSNAFEYKKEMLKQMDLLYSVKKAANLDEVAYALEGFGLKSMYSANWDKRCENVFNNRTSIFNFKDVEKYLDVKIGSNPGGGNSGGGGSSSGGGRGSGSLGSGSITTVGQIVNTSTQMPYENSINVFKDLGNHEWATEAILYLSKNNIVSGKSDGIFAPQDNITREEFTKIIVNLFDISSTDKKVLNFVDVDNNGWYYDYISQAYSAGLITGLNDSEFGIGDEITRQDACVILYRASKYANVAFPTDAVYVPFIDGCSDYAEEAIEMLAKSNIIKGTGNNILNPYKQLTRAEAAKMVYELHCFVENN